MTNRNTTAPNRFETPWSRSGTAIDTFTKADIAALRDSLTVRHIAGLIDAEYDINAVIRRVSKATRHLRLLDNVTVRDSKACLERRNWHYASTFDRHADPLPDDAFVQTYTVTYRRARVTVLLIVNPAAPQPNLEVTVDGTDMHLPFDGDYATLYAARALAAELTTLTV